MDKLLELLLALLLLLSGCSSKAEPPASERHVIAAGASTSYVIDANGTLWECGTPHGQPTSSTDYKWRVVLTDTVSIRVSKNTCIALKKDGTLWGWGDPSYGVLGANVINWQFAPVRITGIETVASFALGSNSVCAVTTDGELWEWGGDYDDSLEILAFGPVKLMDGVRDVAIGSRHHMALKTDGTLWVWGDSDRGQLGNGSTETADEPFKLMDNVKTIACGWSTSFAITNDGTLWTWGANTFGLLGVGREKTGLRDYVPELDSTVPLRVMDGVEKVYGAPGGYMAFAIKSDTTLWAWGNDMAGLIGGEVWSMDNYLEPVKLLDDVVDVDSYTQILVTRSDSSVWGWGDNYAGMLGLEAPETIDQIAVPTKIFDTKQ